MKAQHKTRTPSGQRKSKLGRSGTAKPKSAKEIKKRNKTNEALTEHQHFLQKILDAEPGVVYIYDLEEHRNVYVNRHWLVAFGYTEEETKAMGSELLERICHPDDLPRIFVHHENWQQASQSDIREFEYRVQTKTGEWRWLYSREAAFLLNKVGMVKQILGIAHDITERKQAEDVVRQSEMEYHTLIDTMQEGLGVQDRNGLITFMNKRACEMLGYTLEELVGKPVTFVFDEENQIILRDQMVRRRRGEHQSFEITWLRKDGRKVDTLVAPNPRFDKEGNLVESVAVFTDITEHKRAVEELRASENRYALATKATNDVIWEWDLKTDRLHWNENAQDMFGFPPEEIDSYQTWWKDHLHPEDRERVLSNLDAFLTSRETNWLEEYRIARRDGSYAYIFDRGYVERDASGKPLRMIGAMSDITKRKWSEEILRESQEQYRSLFEDSPISLWLEDFSEVKWRLDQLKENGVVDLATYLREHPEFVIECVQSIRVLDVNSATLKLYHAREKSELLGSLSKMSSSLPPDQFEYELIQIANRQFNFEREAIDQTLTGENIYINVRWSVVHGYEDTLAKVIVSTVDITERKQAEEELRASENRYALASKATNDVIWEWNLKADQLAWHDNSFTMLGYTPEDFSPHLSWWEDHVHPQDLGRILPKLNALIEGGGSTWTDEYRFLRRDGSYAHIVDRGYLEHDADGKPLRMIGAMSDITKRKQAEEKLQRHVNYLMALRDVDRTITSSLGLQTSLDVLISHAVSLLSVDAATILLIDPIADDLRCAAWYGFRTEEVKTARVRLGESYAGRATIEQHMVQIPNLADDPSNLFLTGFLKNDGFVSYYGVPLIVKGQSIGALEVFNRTLIDRDQEWFDFLNTLAGQAAIAIDNAALLENLERSNRELIQAYNTTIEGWSLAMDLRDKETEGHSQRVTNLTLLLAQAMGISESQLMHIRRGSLLHDIGKMGVPDDILLKADKLTETEFEKMRKHPQFAYDMLSSIPYLQPALDIPYCHHEKWDGTGYPRGLKGKEIPQAARIFSVADVWDAITSDRPYRKGWSKANALKYIQEQSGTYFDPQVVDVFLKIIGTSTSDTSS